MGMRNCKTRMCIKPYIITTKFLHTCIAAYATMFQMYVSYTSPHGSYIHSRQIIYSYTLDHI